MPAAGPLLFHWMKWDMWQTLSSSIQCLISTTVYYRTELDKPYMLVPIFGNVNVSVGVAAIGKLPPM